MVTVRAVSRIAVALGPVPCQVQEDGVAISGCTGPQPVELPAAQGIGNGHRSFGGHPVLERSRRRSAVQVPVPSVMADHLREGARVAQELIGSGCKAFLVCCPELVQPGAQVSDCPQFTRGAGARAAESLLRQEIIEVRDSEQSIYLAHSGVDQGGHCLQGNLGVMRKSHNDP